jgi:hypothetical protein
MLKAFLYGKHHMAISSLLKLYRLLVIQKNLPDLKYIFIKAKTPAESVLQNSGSITTLGPQIINQR